MADEAAVWDLVADGRVAIEHVGAPVDAYISDPATRRLLIGSALDLGAALAAHASACATLVDPDAVRNERRGAVWAALPTARYTTP